MKALPTSALALASLLSCVRGIFCNLRLSRALINVDRLVETSTTLKSRSSFSRSPTWAVFSACSAPNRFASFKGRRIKHNLQTLIKFRYQFVDKRNDLSVRIENYFKIVSIAFFARNVKRPIGNFVSANLRIHWKFMMSILCGVFASMLCKRSSL